MARVEIEWSLTKTKLIVCVDAYRNEERTRGNLDGSNEAKVSRVS